MSLLQERMRKVSGVDHTQKMASESPVFEYGYPNPCHEQKNPKMTPNSSQNDDLIAMDEEQKKIRAAIFYENRMEKMTKIANGVIITLSLYIILLIYGVFMTDYQYEDDGEVHPQILSVADIKEKNDFEVILGQYERCRILYEQVLMLDYRLGQGNEDPAKIAPEYEALLDQVEDLAIKTDALDIKIKYDQIRAMLLSWIKNDTAIYLQKMSSAISLNNPEDADIAVAYKTYMYNNFSQLTSNIAVMGEELNGVDVTGIKKWSPESYIDNKINGETGK